MVVRRRLPAFYLPKPHTSGTRPADDRVFGSVDSGCEDGHTRRIVRQTSAAPEVPILPDLNKCPDGRRGGCRIATTEAAGPHPERILPSGSLGPGTAI